IPSPPQAQSAQPSSLPQQQPSQTTDISMTLLNKLMETCATLTQKVVNIEQDKIAQALEITKLKQRVRRLEKKRRTKHSCLKRLKKVGGKIVELDANEDVTIVDVDAEVEDTDEVEPAKVEEMLEVVKAAKLMTEHTYFSMTTLADKAILLGADNHPPMLEKDMYDSWKSRMELYMMNRQHGRMILESVENGPFIWPTIEKNGVTRPRKYPELTPTEAIEADCDVKATNIIL
nr:hypothetical protein [Tanacetum cinerariifolium]